MIDPFILLTPILLLAIVALLAFVGCLSKPDPPGPAITAAPGDERVYLSWDPYTSEIFNGGYDIKRGLVHGGPYTVVGTVPVQSSGFTDSLLTNGTTYYYVVSQGTSEGESSNSQEASATPRTIEFQPPIVENVETLNNNSVTTVPFPRDVGVGNLMVVWIWYSSITQVVSTVTDTGLNSYFRAAAPKRGTSGNTANKQQEIWYAVVANGGPGLAVTAVFSAAFNGEKSITAHEYSGASQSEPFVMDGTSSAAGATANASSGSVTPSVGGLAFGAVVFDASGSSGPGFTQRSSLNGNATEDRRVNTNDPIEATFVNVAESWIAQVVTFK